MEAAFASSERFQERRRTALNQRSLWNCLSDSQRMGANNLSKFGYELVFVRKGSVNQKAVMLNGSSLAVIDESGDIDTNPDIKIR